MVVPPAIVTQPASKSVVAGTNVSFSVAASGTAPLSYHWQFNGAAIAGATNTTLNLTNIQAAQAGNYTVIIANSAGACLTSAVAVLSVTSVRQRLSPSRPARACRRARMSASASTASGTAPLSYRWQSLATGPSPMRPDSCSQVRPGGQLHGHRRQPPHFPHQFRRGPDGGGAANHCNPAGRPERGGGRECQFQRHSIGNSAAQLPLAIQRCDHRGGHQCNAHADQCTTGTVRQLHGHCDQCGRCGDQRSCRFDRDWTTRHSHSASQPERGGRRKCQFQRHSIGNSAAQLPVVVQRGGHRGPLNTLIFIQQCPTGQRGQLHSCRDQFGCGSDKRRRRPELDCALAAADPPPTRDNQLVAGRWRKRQ